MKTISKILIGSLIACALTGCQKAGPTTIPATGTPVSAPDNSFIGSWQHIAKDAGSNATLTFNPDGTMSFTATNGPKQQPYQEKGIGKWEMTGGQLSMTPLSIDFQTPSAANTKKLLPYVKKQENVRSSAPFRWEGQNKFVLTKDKAEQDFERIKQ
jgi:hypothetical protein